jgi:hypothetical protein
MGKEFAHPTVEKCRLSKGGCCESEGVFSSAELGEDFVRRGFYHI